MHTHPLEPQGFEGCFPCFGRGGFPCFFPYWNLQAGNRLNLLFHPVSAGLFHLGGDMSVNVQRKGGGSVSQVFLHRLNVIPGLNRHNRICMSEVMKPSRRRSDFFHKLFEATIDYTVREESPNFIGKYKVLFCPTLSRFEPLSVLFQFLKPEQFHHRGRKRQSSGFVVLGLGEVKLAVLVLLPAKLL